MVALLKPVRLTLVVAVVGPFVQLQFPGILYCTSYEVAVSGAVHDRVAPVEVIAETALKALIGKTVPPETA
jgi:hypothetical protein